MATRLENKDVMENLQKSVLEYQKALRSFKLHFYGNWCGPGWSGPKAPIDDVDTCCKSHDICYEEKGYSSCSCDKEFLRCLEPIKIMCDEEPLKCIDERTAAARFMWHLFKNLPCKESKEGAGKFFAIGEEPKSLVWDIIKKDDERILSWPDSGNLSTQNNRNVGKQSRISR